MIRACPAQPGLQIHAIHKACASKAPAGGDFVYNDGTRVDAHCVKRLRKMWLKNLQEFYIAIKTGE